MAETTRLNGMHKSRKVRTPETSSNFRFPFALALLTLVVGGCIVGPANDGDIPGDDVLDMSGFATLAATEIQISMRNPSTGTWQQIQTAQSRATGQTIAETTMYPWSTSIDFRNLSAFGTPTAEGTSYELRARQGDGYNLTVFDEGGIQCVVDAIQTGTEWLTAGWECRSPDTPVLTVVDRLYGPANQWWHAQQQDIPINLNGSTVAIGQTAPNFTLSDQDGDPVELYQFYGHPIVVKLFAEWCGPCQSSAPHLEQLWRDHEDDGLEVISAMLDDENYQPPNTADLVRWVNTYDITHPVVADDWSNPAFYSPSGVPTYVYIDRQMVVANIGVGSASLDANVAALL